MWRVIASMVCLAGLLAGCGLTAREPEPNPEEPPQDVAAELERWAAQDPALSQLTFEPDDWEGAEGHVMVADGFIEADTLEEFFAPVKRIERKEPEVQAKGWDRLEARVSADIGGVTLHWSGPRLKGEGVAPEVSELFSDAVHVVEFHDGVRIGRRHHSSDEEASAYLRRAAEILDGIDRDIDFDDKGNTWHTFQNFALEGGQTVDLIRWTYSARGPLTLPEGLELIDEISVVLSDFDIREVVFEDGYLSGVYFDTDTTTQEMVDDHRDQIEDAKELAKAAGAWTKGSTIGLDFYVE